MRWARPEEMRRAHARAATGPGRRSPVSHLLPLQLGQQVRVCCVPTGTAEMLLPPRLAGEIAPCSWPWLPGLACTRQPRSQAHVLPKLAACVGFGSWEWCPWQADRAIRAAPSAWPSTHACSGQEDSLLGHQCLHWQGADLQRPGRGRAAAGPWAACAAWPWAAWGRAQSGGRCTARPSCRARCAPPAARSLTARAGLPRRRQPAHAAAGVLVDGFRGAGCAARQGCMRRQAPHRCSQTCCCTWVWCHAQIRTAQRAAVWGSGTGDMPVAGPAGLESSRPWHCQGPAHSLGPTARTHDRQSAQPPADQDARCRLGAHCAAVREGGAARQAPACNGCCAAADCNGCRGACSSSACPADTRERALRRHTGSCSWKCVGTCCWA